MTDRVGGALYDLDLDAAGYRQGLSQAERDFQRTAARIDRIGNDISRSGRFLAVGVTAPIVGIGIAAAKMSADFETTLSRITGLVGDEAAQVRAWGDELLRLGPEVAKSPRELAEALYFVRSSGIAASESMDVVRQSARGAAAGLGDTAIVAQAVTSAMNAYGPETLSAAQATSILIATVREGKAEAADLANAIGRVIPIAAQLGVSFDQVGAALASMTLFGLDTDESVTALRGVFATLLKPSAAANDILERVGLSAAGLRQQLREKGLLSVLTTLATVFAGNEDALAQVIPNIRALTGFLSLAGKNADQVEGIFASLAQTTTADLDNAFAAASDTLGFKFRQALIDAQSQLVRFGDVIAPVLVDFIPTIERGIGVVEKLVTVFTGLPPAVQQGIIVAALLVAALGPILILIGGIASGVSALTLLFPALLAASSFLLPGAALALGLGIIVASMIDLDFGVRQATTSVGDLSSGAAAATDNMSGLKDETYLAADAADSLKIAWFNAEIGILQVIDAVEKAILSGIIAPVNLAIEGINRLGNVGDFLGITVDDIPTIDVEDLGDTLAEKSIAEVQARIDALKSAQSDRAANDFATGNSIQRRRDTPPSAAGSQGGPGGGPPGALPPPLSDPAKILDPLADGIIDLAESIALGITAQEAASMELAKAREDEAAKTFRLQVALFALQQRFPGLTGEGIEFALALETIQDHLRETGQTIEQFLADVNASALDAARGTLSSIFGQPTRETLQLQLRLAELERRRLTLERGGATTDTLADEGKKGKQQPTAKDRELGRVNRDIEGLQREIALREKEFEILRLKTELADKSIQTDRGVIDAADFLRRVFEGLTSSALSAVAALQTLAGVGQPALPQFAAGISYVPQRMTAVLHPGERVLTAEENRRGRGMEFNFAISVADEESAVREATRRLHQAFNRARGGGSFAGGNAFQPR